MHDEGSWRPAPEREVAAMSGGDQPGPLIGAGRTADVYALGERRVLRRYRNGASAEHEAEAMAYLAAAGFPVPVVHEASGTDLVLERLDGRDMLADLSVRPWLVRRHARTLAGLHDRLHAIAAPPSLRSRFGPGRRMLHLDLHPGNVMLTAAGPVVIDWSNVAAGAPAADAAMAWLIMAASEVDAAPLLVRPAISSVRAVLLRRFRALVSDDLGPELARMARARIADPNTRPAEARRLQLIADRAERVAGGQPVPGSR
jgi:aminoglycoside phosphotransferase (APT) family kinase protein